MKHLTSFVICTMLFLTVNCQDIKYQFGKLEPYDMEMKVCPFDQDAHSVVICDIGKIWFAREVDEFEVVFDRFMRFKILDEKGVDNNTLTIPLYHEGKVKEKLKGMRANIWEKSGNIWKVTEMNTNFYNIEELNDNYTLVTYNFNYVKPGNIVEFEYSINSPFFMPIQGWEFQNSIPTMLSFLEVRMIPFYEYKFLYQGKKPDIQNSFESDEQRTIGKNMNKQYGSITFNDVVYHFGMKNLPAAVTNRAKIDFQLSKIIDLNGAAVTVNDTWEKNTKSLLTDDKFGDFIKTAESKADKLIDLNYFKSIPYEDRPYAIVRYIKENYKWNKILGKYAPGKFSDFTETKKGNAGAINLLTIGLLKAAEINAFPIILSTKENADINNDYPFLHLYDYVLIGIRDKDEIKLTDATEPELADDLIPLRCLNSKGLIVQKGPQQWISCNTPIESYTQISITVNPSVSNKLSSVMIDKSTDGYESYLLKNQFKDSKDEIASYYNKKGYLAEAKNITTKNFDEPLSPYLIKSQLLVPILSNDETISIDPFMNEAINVNPLKEELRNYPTDFYYSLSKKYESTIMIPEGFSIEKRPDNFVASNQLIEIDYSIQNEPGKIVVHASYRLLKAIYLPSEYSKLKSYLDQVVTLFNEPITLQKINN